MKLQNFTDIALDGTFFIYTVYYILKAKLVQQQISKALIDLVCL